MDKKTKNELVIGTLGLVAGFSTVTMFRLAIDNVRLKNENSWMRDRVDATVEFINNVAHVEDEETQEVLVKKYDTDIKFIDQIHGM